MTRRGCLAGVAEWKLRTRELPEEGT
jgi:hypothetical protein